MHEKPAPTVTRTLRAVKPAIQSFTTPTRLRGGAQRSAPFGFTIVAALALIHGAALSVRSEETYSGIWRAGADPYYLWAGKEWPEFQKKWEELSKQNLRLVDFETYTEGGRRLYAGVWRGGSDAHYLWVGKEWTEFEKKWAELSKQNLRLIRLKTYVDGGRRLYAGVWRAGNDGHYLWVGKEWPEFEAKWSEFAAKNLRLVDIETYVDGGRRLYAGVWRAGSDGHYLWVGKEWPEFKAKWDELEQKNLRLIDLKIYTDAGRKLYAGVWRAGSDANYLWVGVDWENFQSKWHELAKKNLRLISLAIDSGGCLGGCADQVVAASAYDYGIKMTTTHCPGLPGTCGRPGPNDVVFYHWPVDLDGGEKFARLSALYFKDSPGFTIPFSDRAVKHLGMWLYSPGSWHHAIDYLRDDRNTFQVRAAAPGRVIHIGWDMWSGNTIILSHDAGGVKDAYRTIYMHMHDGPANDCQAAWSQTIPRFTTRPDLAAASGQYKQFLSSTGCTQNPATRNPDPNYWGNDSQKIDMHLLGMQVPVGQVLGWAGSTGPGGCGCIPAKGGPNTHLHIFFARRDPANNQWYFIDPYGIYGPPSCYPAGTADPATTVCARYPSAWRGGKPQYP